MLNKLLDLEKVYNNNMIAQVLSSNNYAPIWEHEANFIDKYILLSYGGRELLEYYKLVEEEEVKKDFETLLYVFLKSKEVEYNKIYNVQNLSYNPIENYSMTETEHGNNTTDNMYGTSEEINSYNRGQRETSDTITYGEVNETATNNIGEIVNTVTDTNTRAPFDNENYENVNKTNANNTTDARKDETVKVTEAKTDSNISIDKAYDDSMRTLKNSHEDTLHTEYSHTLTRSGNIGVTTSQQMIESELVLAEKMKFVERVARDVANMLSKGVYYAL